MQKIEKVILVFKTHFDIGFTDLSEKVLNQYAGPMLEDVLKTCEETQGMGSLAFKWTMPAWPLKYILENAKPQLLAPLEKLVRSGRIVWHALPFTSHTDFASEQELLQGLCFARQLAHKYGRPLVKTAKMTDVPGHGGILPSVLAHAGVGFLHLGCNQFAAAPKVPQLFFWQAPDNLKLLTMYCPDGYGSGIVPPAGWPFPVWMAFMHTHDNMGPQNAQSIAEIAKAVQAKHPGAQVVSGTMEDFYSELLKQDLSVLPVVKKDLADTWIHGTASYPKELGLVRGARRKLGLASFLSALPAAKAQPGSAQQISQIYKQLVMFAEHTWGLDVKTWLAGGRVYQKQAFLQARETPQYKYIQASWAEQAARAQLAFAQSEKLLQSLQTGGSALVANPGGTAFSGWVPVQSGAQALLQSAPLEMMGGKYIYVENIPALSLQAPQNSPPQNAAPALSLTKKGEDIYAENHRYIVVFNDKSGTISHVFDKRLNKNILQKNGQNGVFAYRYDKYGNKKIEKYLEDYGDILSDWGVKDNGRENYPETADETFTPHFKGWRHSGSSLHFLYAGTACASYGDAEEISLSLTLPPKGQQLFVQLQLKAKQATPFVEAGSLVFPLAEKQPEYKINKNGWVLNPKTDIEKGANHVFYCVDAFMAAEKNACGVCIVPFDTPLAAIGETGVYTFRQEYEETPAEFYSNLFNNMWGTNFPQWVGGSFSFSYAVFGYTGEENPADIANGLLAGTALCLQPAAAPPAAQLPGSMKVVGLAAVPGGLHIVARSTLQTKRRASIKPGKGFAHIQRADVFGNAQGPPGGSCLVEELAPYGLTSFIVS